MDLQHKESKKNEQNKAVMEIFMKKAESNNLHLISGWWNFREAVERRSFQDDWPFHPIGSLFDGPAIWLAE